MSRKMKSDFGRFVGLLCGEAVVFGTNATAYVLAIRGLTANELTYYGLAQAAVQWITPIALLSLGSYGAGLVASSDRSRVVGQALTRIRIVVASVIAPLAVILLKSFSAILPTIVALEVAVAVATRALERDHISVGEGRTFAYMSFRLTYGVMNAALVVSALTFMRHISAAVVMAAMIAALGCGVLVQCSVLRVRILGTAIGDCLDTRYVISSGVALTAGTFFMMGAYNVDVFLLAHYEPNRIADIGLYSALAKTVQFGVVPMTCAVIVYSPRICIAVAKGDRKAFKHTIRKLKVMTMSAGMVGALAISVMIIPLLSKVSGKDFSAVSSTAVWFGVLYALIGVAAPFVAILPYLRQTRRFLLYYALLFGATIAAEVIAIQDLGMIGAVVGVDIGMAILVIAAVAGSRSAANELFAGLSPESETLTRSR